ncbi:site-specific DNA-methyltransferase [Candidatus Poribacteria bacterium]|nr:MAG: site-specific DNA-methyltransferase [Candidatus Poribacteria bacterium]
MLNWKGKRPFQSTQYYPAQLKEMYGEEVEDWINKIYWGDNLQVMSHLLKTYRGKINLIYIDPPFDSKADYKKRIELKGKKVQNDRTAFEEKQYTDIWTNDEYLQFMYERLILMKELLTDNGSVYVHCDWRVSAYIRLILDEVFGKSNFINEIIWHFIKGASGNDRFGRKHQVIFWYSKSSNNAIFNRDEIGVEYNPETIARAQRGEARYNVTAGDLLERGKNPGDVWSDLHPIQGNSIENTRYATQKPEALLDRIINASSNPDDLVLDCFMGSGTTQAVAMKLGRRFIGADINLGAVETTTKRLTNLMEEIEKNRDQGEIDTHLNNTEDTQTLYTGFEVYNVNHYDVFRNPVEAKTFLIEALEIQPLPTGGIYDGEKDGRMVKLMPINRIATRADLNDLIFGFDYRAFQWRQEEYPTRPVEKLLLVCMGHEPDLAAALQNEVAFTLDIEVVDILRDKSNLEFKRESEAVIVRRNGQLIIEQFYPMNLLQKLSLMQENVEDWKELVESVKIDFNYDGAVLNPSVVDLSEDDTFVKGTYPIPSDAGTIRVKITDLLSESLEITVE